MARTENANSCCVCMSVCGDNTVAELWLRLGGCDYDCWDAGGWGRQGVGAKKGCALLLG